MQKVNAQEGDEGLDSIVTGDETWGFHHTSESKQAGKKFDDDDEVQEEVMIWFKGLVADFYDSGIQKLFPRLYKCLENASDYIENKVMYRQFIHSVAFLN
jgi:hypothetical protein